MSKSKEGDWVAVVDSGGGGKVGDIRLVAYVKAEEATAEDKPEFKIGDHVRMVRSVEGLKADCVATIVDDDGARYKNLRIRFGTKQVNGIGPGEMEWWVDPRDIAHAAAAPDGKPLKIEEGKYYRTRDGRKVGPLEMVYGKWGGAVSGDATRIFKDNGKHGSFFVENNPQLDLVAPWTDDDNPAGTAIVCRIENGKPRPASEPYIHANAEAAGREASRLAGLAKGDTFGVYTCAATVCEPVPVKTYAHEWQRQAIAGRKISAIKELRAVTGLGPATTKRAVEDWLERETA